MAIDYSKKYTMELWQMTLIFSTSYMLGMWNGDFSILRLIISATIIGVYILIAAK